MSKTARIIVAGIALTIIFASYFFLQHINKNDIIISNAQETSAVNEESSKPSESPKSQVTPTPEPKLIFVDVGGRVKTPGLVRLTQGARVNDAITLAGGVLSDADTDGINLAAFIGDGEKVYVPKKGQVVVPQTGTKPLTGSSANISTSSQQKININTANTDELDKIPGVGKTTAQSILNYRNSKGSFSKLEDLQNVKGIGAKTFEKIKNYITI